MAKKQSQAVQVYGTEILNGSCRSNHPIKSRYMAAVLSIVLGIAGVNQFYLRNIVRGILKIVFSLIFVILAAVFNSMLILVPIILSVLTGISYLCQSDVKFQQKNHVRTI